MIDRQAARQLLEAITENAISGLEGADIRLPVG
jgi:hypothetical protein